MDQVKLVLSQLVKHWFWVACGIMVPLLLGGWFVTTNGMNVATEQGKSRINNSFGIVKGIRATSPHPNATSKQGLEESEKEIAAEVLGAWRIQYEQQRKFLVWPKELGDEFIAQVDTFRPIEKLKYEPNDQTNEIDVKFRETYRNYIQEELPKLAQIIGADWLASSAAGSMD